MTKVSKRWQWPGDDGGPERRECAVMESTHAGTNDC